VITLTLEQREALIDILIDDYLQSAADCGAAFVERIFLEGFRGFANYTNEELLSAYRDAFDEDWVPLDSYDVEYVETLGESSEVFRCMAEDERDAVEQMKNANPGATLLDVCLTEIED
jgi:hypothetical protein